MKMQIETTVVTKIKGVSKRAFTTKAGKDAVVVIVYTEAGKFSNFESVWEKQNLDLGALKEDDPIEITYTTYVDEVHNREYKNFIGVRPAGR